MSKQDLKVKARDSFKEFAKQELGEEFGKLTHKQRSWTLVRWYVERIHNPLRSPISEDDLELSHVDNPDDLGADFIYRDDAVVYIYQAKYISPDSSLDIKDIQHFQSVLQRLYDRSFKKNSKLSDIVSEIAFDSDQFKMKFLCLGSVGKPESQAVNQTTLEPILPTTVKDLADRVDYEFLDEGLLTEELRQAQTVGGDIPHKDFEIVTCLTNGKRTGVISFEAGEHRSCVLVTDARQLLQIYKDSSVRDRLFTLNIRNYLGNTSKNKAMKETATNNPAEFYHFNNGISCVAKSLSVLADRVKVNELQVINGAQTVKALLNAQRKNTWDEKGVPLILLRIIEVPKGYGPQGTFRSDVIKFNNTQNIIRISDFRSNDSVQEDLRKKFGEITRHGRRVVYRPKRTDEKPTNSEIIPMEEFAKVIYSFLINHYSFSGNTACLFDEEGGYREIFGDGAVIWDQMPSDEFKLRSAIWWMSQEFGKALKRDKEVSTDSDEKNALERKYPVLFVARLILERSLGKSDYREELAKCYEGRWKLGEEKEGKWFKDIYDVAKTSVIYRYADARENQKETFNHRNWMRSRKTSEDLERYIKKGAIKLVGPISDYK